jgi:hypothetical protein
VRVVSVVVKAIMGLLRPTTATRAAPEKGKGKGKGKESARDSRATLLPV